MSTFSRRGFLGLSLAAAAAAAGCAPERVDELGTAEKPITIGYLPIVCATPLVLADAAGFFDDAGVSVELRKFGGWSDLWSAYTGGDIDVAHMLTPMALATAAGLIGETRPTHIDFSLNTNGSALTLASGLTGEVSSPADLAGLTIGIPQDYSVHNLLVRDLVEASGLAPDRDLELRLLRPPDMVAQLTVGEIDGFIVAEPFNRRALDSGVGRVFQTSAQMWDRHPCCALAMSTGWRSRNEQAAAALRGALGEAAGLANDPAARGDVAEALGAEQYLNQPAGLIEPVLAGDVLAWDGTTYRNEDYTGFGDPVSETALTWIATQLSRLPLPEDRTLDFDDDAIRAAAGAALPENADTSLDPAVVNGREFDPAHPTASARQAA